MKLDGKWIGFGLGDTGDQVRKIQHRLLFAYPRNSGAIGLGVTENGYFDEPTRNALQNLQLYLNSHENAGLHSDGICDYRTSVRIGAYVPGPVIYRSKYPIQGVWADSRAFLSPPDAHSFVKATNDFAAEAIRLYSGNVGEPIIPIAYSMGGVSVCKFLHALRPEWRQYVAGVVTFGDPSMPATGSLNGDTPGEGISRMPQPDWCRDRYWSYAIDGDWYPQARGLLFMLYDLLSRAELTLDFAVYLFTVFPLQAMQELMGARPSSNPFDAGLNGVLGMLGGLITSGPASVIGSVLGPMQLMAILPQLVFLLFDAIKFIATGAHGRYGDPAYALWDGQTGVDHAARMIREHVPDGAWLYLFPGSWSNWDQLFQFDVAVRLQ